MVGRESFRILSTRAKSHGRAGKDLYRSGVTVRSDPVSLMSQEGGIMRSPMMREATYSSLSIFPPSRLFFSLLLSLSELLAHTMSAAYKGGPVSRLERSGECLSLFTCSSRSSGGVDEEEGVCTSPRERGEAGLDVDRWYEGGEWG